MLGEIGIKRGTGLDSGRVVFNDLFQRGETAIMHVGRCHGDVAQGGDGEFAAVTFFGGDKEAAKVAGAEVETIVGETQARSEEHTSELQSQSNLVCRLLL